MSQQKNYKAHKNICNTTLLWHNQKKIQFYNFIKMVFIACRSLTWPKQDLAIYRHNWVLINRSKNTISIFNSHLKYCSILLQNGKNLFSHFYLCTHAEIIRKHLNSSWGKHHALNDNKITLLLWYILAFYTDFKIKKDRNWEKKFTNISKSEVDHNCWSFQSIMNLIHSNDKLAWREIFSRPLTSNTFMFVIFLFNCTFLP